MKLRKLKNSLIVGAFLTFMVAFSGCSSCMSAEWQKVYDEYMRDPDGYQYIKAVITDIRNYSDNLCLTLEVDAEDYEERYKNDDVFLSTGGEKWRADLAHYNNEGFICIASNLKILTENGFFDAVNENTVITIYTHKYLGWIGWQFPILGAQIGDKTYLDFETGKENFLNYIQENIDNP